MYFSDLGNISLILALAFSLYAVLAAVFGAVRSRPRFVSSAKRALLAVTFFMLLASVSLIASFLNHDFGVIYVAQQSDLSMPWYFTASAFYGGQDGSLLYWALVLSIFSAIFVLTSKRAPTRLVPYVVATLMAIQAFFVFVLTLASNPFARSLTTPADGSGLNPLLMDPGMLVHPPTLLMGYMSFSLPFAFAVAAMITGQLNSEWLRAIRRWTLASWVIQSAGLILGAWWAYHVLGWGGYWGWDPVENAALLPWLTATAFLHSTMVQERRGMLKVWNLVLVVLSFALSIFGTFEVRSGVISSVHSFAYSNIGSYFLTFLVVIIVFSSALFFIRLPKLRAEQEFDSALSREGVFLLNNLMLLGMTFAILWGTLFPLISQFLFHQTMTVGAPFYEQVVTPLIGLLVLAMGIGPLLAWRRTSLSVLWRNLSLPLILSVVCAALLPVFGVTNLIANVGFSVCAFTALAILYELWRGMRVRHGHGESYIKALFMLFSRYRQRYGGYLVHLGLVFLVMGIIGSHFFQYTQDSFLKAGQDMNVGAYRLTYFGNIDRKEPAKETLTAQLQVWYNGQLQGYVYPGRINYTKFDGQPVSLIEIKTFVLTDVYILLTDTSGAGQASIRVFVNPLVPLVWWGAVVMILGGIICWWPARRRATSARTGATATVQSPVPGTQEATV